MRPLLEAGGEAEELELELELGEVEASTATSVEVSHISHDDSAHNDVFDATDSFFLTVGNVTRALIVKRYSFGYSTTLSPLKRHLCM